MDHVVYVDAKAKEMENIISKKKTIIIRGAAGRKMPHGRVFVNDVLFFINNNAEGLVKAKAIVKWVFNSEKMSNEESISIVEKNMDELKLSDKQFAKWVGKRYLVLIKIKDVKEIAPFQIDKSSYGNMDDWLPVGKIDEVKI